MIQTSGVGSGLDIRGLVDQLLSLERSRRLEPLTQRVEFQQAQISAFGTIRSGLSTLRTAAQDLNQLINSETFTATSSDEESISVTVDPASVSEGSYSIEVLQLAKAHKKIGTAGFATSDEALGLNGGFRIDKSGTTPVGSGEDVYEIEVDAGDSLSDIATKINEHEDNDHVVASVIKVDDGDYRLTLTATDTGADSNFSITDPVSSPSLQVTLGIDGAGTVVGQDAQFNIGGVGGITVSRATNTVSDLVDGVVFDLKQATTGTAVNIDVVLDDNATNANIVSKVSAFVDAYNTIIDSLDRLRSEALTGDSTISSIKRQLQSVLRGVTGSSEYSYFSQLGFRTAEVERVTTEGGDQYVISGKIELDTTVLTQALDTNFEEVLSVLTDENTGFVTRFSDVVDQITQTGGLIDNKTDSIEASIDRNGDLILREERRLESVEARLLRQYNAMDSLVASLQSQGNFLLQQLDGLNLQRNNEN